MKWIIAAACAVSWVFPALSRADLRYTVEPDVPNKRFKVTLTVDQVDSKIEVRIPAWCPGFYTLLHYQDKISDFQAKTADGSALTFTHDDPRGWVIADPTNGDVTVSYSVKADDNGLGFFADVVHKRDAFVSGPATFMYPVDRTKDKTALRIVVPNDWDIATAMDLNTEGDYEAKNYDEFVDSPIQLGKFQTRKFKVSGVPFTAVFVSSGVPFAANLTELVARLQTESAEPLKMFGGASFKRYTYFFHFTNGGFLGGLEHRACTVIAIPDGPQLQIDELAAHEYFHAWNVKQIRPKALGPFDYTKECRTGNLWFAEGVTDYYAYRETYLSGLQSSDWLMSQLGIQVRELQAGSTRNSVTLEQCCRQEWENGGFGSVGDLSYYNKGSLVGLILDAEIRGDTDGVKSLDDVMRAMYGKYKLPQPGYDEDGIRAAVSAVAGKDLNALYDAMVRGTGELPYDVLRKIGLRVVAPNEKVRVPGYQIDAKGAVTTVGSQNDADGLRVGDRIVEVHDSRYNGTYKTPGTDVPELGTDVMRNGYPVRLNLHLVYETSERFALMFDSEADKKAIARRGEWLKRAEGAGE